MATMLAYRGAAPLLAQLKDRLEDAGYRLGSETAAAEVVLTFFTNQPALEEAYFASEGLIATAAPGTLLVDLSATTPDFARDVATMATVSELDFVAAPIALRDVASETPFAPENIAMFIAGDDAPLTRVRPLLELVSAAPTPARSAAAAQLARSSLTLQTTAIVIAAVESAALCGRYAASPHGPAEPVAACDLETSVLEAIAHETFASPFTIEMMMGELTAALAAAEDIDLILPQAEAAQNLLELLAIIGGIDKAPAALSLIYDSEEAATRHGLDWSRAASFDADDHDHDHGHDDEFDEFDDFDDDEFPMMVGFEDSDDEPYQGLGVDPFQYSSN